ncbi:hypothetical protein KR044_010873, partial [Drosophila immigrans]
TMKQKEGVLIVDPPEELVLEGPFNRAVCKKILVNNPSKLSRTAFKLKTTTPRLFFVRPNVGLVLPGESVTIDIFVHPICHDTNTQRHKFLMQMAEANGEVMDVHQFWKTVDPTAINEIKIKVKLLEPNKMAAEEIRKSTFETVGNSMEGQVVEKDNDPLANLLKQVNELEEERQTLLQKIEQL